MGGTNAQQAVGQQAATPAGVASVPHRNQGWRSFLAPPLANGWHPSGMFHARAHPEPGGFPPPTRCSCIGPGGFPAISRWSRANPTMHGHPSRCSGPEPGAFPAISRWSCAGPDGFPPPTRCPCIEPGGFPAISRWWSEERATPPGSRPKPIRIPEGCQP